jgi:plastocyanin
MRPLIVITALLVAVVGCGDDGTDPSPGASAATITITAAGVNPASVTINAGGSVTFVNNDTVAHQPSSDPHPAHTDCPGLNLNVLNANGGSGQTQALNTRRTCTYHDHLNDTVASLKGTIIVQ